MSIHDLSAGAPSRKRYDACVLGAGPAGITLARVLARAGKQVALVEGGGLAYAMRSQELYDAQHSGAQAWANLMRLRFLGGTSNHWAGRCRPFEARDFERELPTGYRNWPIPLSELEPFQAEALRLLDIEPDQPFREAPGSKPLSDAFVPDRDAHSAPTRFGEKFRAEIADSTRIHLLLHANAIRMAPGDHARRAEFVELANYDGERARIEAEFFVVAMGALENVRFLLHAAQGREGGFCNASGWVGRGFMEHLNIVFGRFAPADPGDPIRMNLFTSDAFLEAHPHAGRSNVALSMAGTPRSFGRTAALKSFLKELACDLGIANTIRDSLWIDCPGDGMIRSLTEQFPSDASFVELTDRVDRFGVPQPRFHWELSPEDRRSVRDIGVQLAKDFVDGGAGVIQLAPGVLDEGEPLEFAQHAHHMGGTRMASEPRYGAVDTDCRVFGVDNVYVAGSSVFSSGGACNPTMPIVQLALRLGEHLAARPAAVAG